MDITQLLVIVQDNNLLLLFCCRQLGALGPLALFNFGCLPLGLPCKITSDDHPFVSMYQILKGPLAEVSAQSHLR